MRNLSIDRTRRRTRRGALTRELVPDEPPVSERSLERLFVDASEHAKVRRALTSLPDAQRETLEIAFFEGLSYPEIAARENVPVGTIESRAARALSTLRFALATEGEAMAVTEGLRVPRSRRARALRPKAASRAA